jgi:hypothetical protein
MERKVAHKPLPMLNLGQVVATVQKNCHISDAQYAGDYTLCIFLLKMREFYRWENQILSAVPCRVQKSADGCRNASNYGRAWNRTHSSR